MEKKQVPLQREESAKQENQLRKEGSDSAANAGCPVPILFGIGWNRRAGSGSVYASSGSCCRGAAWFLPAAQW